MEGFRLGGGRMYLAPYPVVARYAVTDNGCIGPRGGDIQHESDFRHVGVDSPNEGAGVVVVVGRLEVGLHILQGTTIR